MNRVLIVIFAIAVLLGVAVLVKNGQEQNSLEEYLVELRVSGTASNVMITYMNAQKDIEQVADAKTPWSKTFKCTGNNYLSISAQNLAASGSVIVSIFVNGALANSAQSEGAYVIAQTQSVLSSE